MGLNELIKKASISLGNNNNPAIAVVCIAMFKGVARPLFTMMDEKEDYETKKYAAIREGLTEVVAIPTYIGAAKLAGWLAGPLTKKLPHKIAEAQKTLAFVGVCTAALLIIPAACSFTIKPLMDYLQEKKKQDSENETKIAKPDTMNPVDKKLLALLETSPQKPNLSPVFTTFTPVNSGMKVGG